MRPHACGVIKFGFDSPTPPESTSRQPDPLPPGGIQSNVHVRVRVGVHVYVKVRGSIVYAPAPNVSRSRQRHTRTSVLPLAHTPTPYGYHARAGGVERMFRSTVPNVCAERVFRSSVLRC